MRADYDLDITVQKHIFLRNYESKRKVYLVNTAQSKDQLANFMVYGGPYLVAYSWSSQ